MNAAGGEENSDEMKKKSGKIKFNSNQAGGILGGISLIKILLLLLLVTNHLF